MITENMDKTYKQQVLEKLHQASLAYDAVDVKDEAAWDQAWEVWHPLWMEALEICEEDKDFDDFNAINAGSWGV